MVEFYFGELVEYVREQSQKHPRLEAFIGEDTPLGGPLGDDAPEDSERRGSTPELPLSFCREGCYWPCEHR